ncbi:hypothetical protein SHD_3350 [Shewanella decolorationis S12]|uniref:Uncharacterized protein n=2 Tax=Shewanella decolorationis TaxID=256839 RepID=A0ABN0PJY8_9GAMM|nr:hypothetical protein SHD_3350 [Shewanella decolorationis S12]
MKVSELQEHFITELMTILPEWKFVKSQRLFKKKHGDLIWYLYISCINHDSDFDAVGNVAVEYLSGKERICIVGAELGNIEGCGQTRFPVSSLNEAIDSAHALFKFFEEIGLPFLTKYSQPKEVVSVLRSGGKSAMLISPLINQHETQIKNLCQKYGIGM